MPLAFNLLNEYLEKTQEDKNRKEKESKPVGFNEIEIRDLTFSYDGKKDILTDVNFRIQKGKKYLIIGESGQGKSTFLNLLLKNIETNSIFLDHKPIQELSYSVYVQNFACVYQNEPLLPGTLKENIVLNNKIDEYELIEKLHAFHLDSLIDRLDLPLQEDAPQISGGQLQKIHILRSLLSQRNILILDDGFSINGASLKPLKIQVVECHKKNNLNSRMRRNEKWQSNMTKNLRNR